MIVTQSFRRNVGDAASIRLQARRSGFFVVRPRTLAHFTTQRNGLSLLEVILSIAILGASMVVISQLFNLGLRNAHQARLRSESNILCDSKMAELAAGVLPLETTGTQTITENSAWNYSIDVESSAHPGLLVATVTVTQSEQQTLQPVSLSIVRFLPDPDYEPEPK